MFGIYLVWVPVPFVCHMNNASFPCAGNNVGKVDAGLDTLLEEAMFFSMRLGGVRWYKPLEN